LNRTPLTSREGLVNPIFSQPRQVLLLSLLIGWAMSFPCWAGEPPRPNHPFLPDPSPEQQAEILLSMRQYSKALEEFQRLIGDGSQEPTVYRGLAKSYEGTGQLAEGKRYLEKLLNTDPGNANLLFGMGFMHFLMGEFGPAEDRLNASLDQSSGNALAWNTLGAVLAEKKSYSEAIKKVKRAIELDPSDLRFYQNLKQIYEEMGETGLFIAEYKKSLETGPHALSLGYGRTLANSLRQKGFRLYSEGKPDETRKAFSDMLELYREINYPPGVVQALFSLGILYEESGDLQTAYKFYEEVLKINPGHIQAREKLRMR